jgi:hypothetical protein
MNHAMAYAHAASPVLFVESGLHKAARTALGVGQNRVGAALDNDIVLSDLPAGTSFVLDHWDGGVLVQAVDLYVDLPGHKSLAPGRSRRFIGDTRFISGGVAFRLEIREAAPALLATPRRSKILTYGSASLGGALCIAMLNVVASVNGAPSAKTPDITFETTGSIPVSTADHVVAKSSEETGATLESLRRHLAVSGLDAITLTAEPDASIEARGQITPQQDAAWRETGRWFDTVARGRGVLVNQVRVSAEPPPLAVQSVWPGHDPYVIDGSGDKLFVGSVLQSGWTISGIDAERVLITHGEQALAVRF